MNKIINCKWKVNFDKCVTEQYYRNYNDLCQCSSCINFYKNTDSIFVETRKFIEQFGADITKPIELESIIADKKRGLVEYTAYYAVYGTIELLEESNIEIGVNSINIISKDISPNTDISEPYFVITINHIWLPWTVDDNINDSYD